MTALLDINVILDVLLARPPWVTHSQALWQACDEARLGGHIAAASLPTIFYLVRRSAGVHKAWDAVKVCLDAFQVCPITTESLRLATTLPGSDFEDNLQIACATLAGLDAIITRDPRGFTGSKVPVMTPAELLHHLAL